MYGLHWKSLQWGFGEMEDFFVGPNTVTRLEEQTILNSMNLEHNTDLYRVIDKKGLRGNNDKWALFACKNCAMWMYAISSDERRVAYLMNTASNSGAGIPLGKDDTRVPVMSTVKLPFIMEQQGEEMIRPSIKYARSFDPAIKRNYVMLT